MDKLFLHYVAKKMNPDGIGVHFERSEIPEVYSSLSAAWAAESLAMGTRKGEHDT